MANAEVGTVRGTARELSEDDVFDVLSNQRRRYAYHYLKNAEDPELPLRELVDNVAAWECGKEVHALTSTERNRVSTALHQFHLPKMDDCGFVEYDDRRAIVTLSEPATDLEVYLDVVPGRDIPWSRYYLGLTGINVGVFVGVVAGLPPMAWLPDVSWLAFVVASLLVSAAVHTLLTRRLRIGSTTLSPESES
ncbi:DUF7344 domain-containing protein [Halomarina rubra]|uniref:DUF7344 domain-containing protein n=1 Tax=Halomarina rubra TaxID=2071873 RepID=A0ABD6ARR7_9EURY|nr:hypothetical protein [Halomarina rubra]